jgi:hypothetical protein
LIWRKASPGTELLHRISDPNRTAGRIPLRLGPSWFVDRVEDEHGGLGMIGKEMTSRVLIDAAPTPGWSMSDGSP